MAGPVTLQDVADHAGVSRATASLVLRETGRVSTQTRQRVTEAMSTLGYVYNRGAASLRTQTANTIGVVVTHIASPFFGEAIHGLETGLTDSGYLPLLVNTDDDPGRQQDAIQKLREHQVAGLALVPATGTKPSLIDQLRAWNMEHVLVSRYIKDVDAPYVGADDVVGGRLAATHLIETHESSSIAYLGGLPAIMSRTDRTNGVKQAMARHGLDPTSLVDVPGAVTGAGGLELGQHLIASGLPLPDGIICHSDSVAFGLYRALRIHGLGTETRVIGYDNIGGAALWEPPLTSVATQGEALGRRAARMLLERIKEPGAPTSIDKTIPELAIRQSCGCP
ncbi:LacI family DNA-binding transcriptional regulator [Arthrobacter sp. ISL-95]|uniref:LacI family DNA-binding transcriptional regulator n=1 Tax=Arthrobacter sp. ISL-95 TaxID=2819116 RepID=UPI001BE84038|nr:LacI family DNA-binding transcriptional regulator [Arthrobacter sp. ISL-95]MBT2586457.1 LacI family DNA-binding transcriptional regulator [Arthrobacter sp. ISL-95]